MEAEPGIRRPRRRHGAALRAAVVATRQSPATGASANPHSRAHLAAKLLHLTYDTPETFLHHEADILLQVFTTFQLFNSKFHPVPTVSPEMQVHSKQRSVSPTRPGRSPTGGRWNARAVSIAYHSYRTILYSTIRPIFNVLFA